MTSFQPAIEVFDIRNFAAPVKTGELALPTRPGLGTESHDISFSKDGTRAYSAALSQGVVIDTTNPDSPSVITSASRATPRARAPRTCSGSTSASR